MAGFYPDAPGPRMAYDRDGTAVYFSLTWPPTSPQPMSQASLQAMNDESDATQESSSAASGNLFTGSLIFIFPELRDLVAYMVNGVWDFGDIQTSADTTNGVDGTWTTRAAGTIGKDPASAYRTGWTPLAVSGVKGLRMRRQMKQAGERTSTLHLYGHPSAGQDLNRLRIWHPTLDEEVGPAYFDWADRPQSSSADRTFRVKNDSQLLRAMAPVVSLSALTNPSPSVTTQHFLSTDGVNFAATAALGSLEPQAISPVVTLRYNVASNAATSVWSARVAAVATTWEVA